MPAKRPVMLHPSGGIFFLNRNLITFGSRVSQRGDNLILHPVILNLVVGLKFILTPISKTLPKSSAFINRISLRFCETDCMSYDFIFNFFEVFSELRVI